jgi:endonuclease/exonuclease/phosphatase family metal-dependent hydrolase
MSLKVLGYNIREGGRDRLAEITAVIRGHRPDLAALIEATDRDAAERLARALDLEVVIGEAANGYDVAWLSRLPIRRAENHRSLQLAKTLFEVEVRVEGNPVCLFATHLGSRHDLPQPADEVPVILEVLRPRDDRPHLLVGDFNALHPDDPVGTPPPGVERRGEAIDGAPRPAIRRFLDAGYVDGYRTLHPETPGYTYPAEAPWLRLDYIFLSPRLAPRLVACDVATGPEAARASDHLAVWAELA